MKTGIISFLFVILTTQIFANRIDNLMKDDDVESFLHKQDKDLRGFNIVPLSELYYNTAYQKIADSLGIKTWQKTDFDNNGFTDLLIYGKWNGENCLLVVIDEGDKFTLRSFNRGFFPDIYFPVLATIDNQVFLLLNKSCEYCEKAHAINTDTLIYKYGIFVEPNVSFTSHKIEKITFSTTSCLGTCPVFELGINADRTADYKAIEYNRKKGTFKTIIDTTHFNAIVTLLNYINFPVLKDNYAVNWTDDQAVVLSITYDNGKTKTIMDYGKLGTFGLTTVYNKLFSLRKNQKWKKEHKK